MKDEFIEYLSRKLIVNDLIKPLLSSKLYAIIIIIFSLR